MRLCVRTDVCGNDVERVADYCRGMGVHHVWSFPMVAEAYGEDRLMKAPALQSYREEWRQRGLHLSAVSEVIEDADLTSEQGPRAKAASLRSILAAMQAADVELLFLVLNIRAGETEDERQARWARLAELYRGIVPHAEATGRRIANHGHQTREHLVFSAAEMERLLSLAPSAANGLTFCTGCYQLAGDDLSRWIGRFGRERILMVHMRDVRRRAGGGFDEVLFGEGEVDLKAVVKRLKEINYQGLICPEHLPRVAYDPFDEIPTAWGMGYLRALLAD